MAIILTDVLELFKIPRQVVKTRSAISSNVVAPFCIQD